MPWPDWLFNVKGQGHSVTQNYFFYVFKFSFLNTFLPCINLRGHRNTPGHSSVPPSVRPFVHHFSSFCTFADKSLEGNDKIWHAGVSRWLTLGRHWCRWVLFSFYAFVRPTLREFRFWHCGHISWKKKSTFSHADVFRWLTLSLLVSVRLFTTFLGFFAFADKLLGRNGWVGVGFFSKMVATFNHAGGSFNLFMATSGVVWIIPSFRIWDYMLRVGHISCVITNWGQHQGVIPSPLSIAL